MNDIVLISDSSVLKIPIKENHELMVHLSGHAEIVLDGRKRRPDDFRVRKTVLAKLLDAYQHLPPEMKFLVVESFRPISIQVKYFNDYSDDLKKIHPEWDLFHLCGKYF